uniref:centrosomal protein of 112 kDa-like n=1 Tax=Styela clava TaxID=7725 RepID=UPI00193A2D29|nr:centrosomal protein of 112 kDa-like [Styela clava]
MASSRSVSSSCSRPYTYPGSPDTLKIFTEHGLLERPKTHAVDFLSYMLSKTSLETQKITHSQIQDAGEKLYQKKIDKFDQEKKQAVLEAVHETQRLADENLKKELALASEKAEIEKEDAVEALKHYNERVAARTDRNRGKIEQEREEKLILRLNEEKKKALAEQWKLAEKLKAEAIERVLTEQRRSLRAEAALQREKAIADALRIAREKFKNKLNDEVEKTKRFCEKIMQDEIRKIQDLHQVEVIKLRERIAAVERQLEVQMDKMRRAQRDYWEMENEYCNFLDYTSKVDECPSGFLIAPKKRQHGKGDSNRDQNVQTRLISLDQGTKTVQTDLQIRL